MKGENWGTGLKSPPHIKETSKTSGKLRVPYFIIYSENGEIGESHTKSNKLLIANNIRSIGLQWYSKSQFDMVTLMMRNLTLDLQTLRSTQTCMHAYKHTYTYPHTQIDTTKIMKTALDSWKIPFLASGNLHSYITKQKKTLRKMLSGLTFRNFMKHLKRQKVV